MPPTIFSRPLVPTETTQVPANHAWTGQSGSQITDTLTHNTTALIAALTLSAAVLLVITRKIRTIAKSDRPDEPLANLAMLIGLGWSSEAVWELTGRVGFPISLRLLMFFVLETLLILAMIRAKRAMQELGHPGRSGRTAWIVASAMAAVAAGVSKSIAEGVLRLLIPLLVTNAWWDGLVGEDYQKPDTGKSTRRWTLRRFLLWIGAIEPGERDVETVHRDRLTQQMTTLYYLKLHGAERLRQRRTAKLAKLTLTADDAIVAEVMRRVRRTGWANSEPLPYTPGDGAGHGDAPADAGPERISAEGVTHLKTRRFLPERPASAGRVTVPPNRRVKAAASGDAGDADPATRAAHLVLTQKISHRRAAEVVGGTSAATVRRRLKEILPDALADGSDDAHGTPALTQIPDPTPPVTAGVNGHPHPSQEVTR